MSSKRVLVTGATGFVGSHLCHRLVRDGYDVHAIIRPQSKLDQIADIEHALNINVHDGSTAGMLKIVEKSAPTLVFHLASLFLSQHGSEDIEALIKSNITFGTQLLEAIARHKIPFLINTGTAWQHYHNQKYNPVNLYAATKEAFQSLLKFYTETSQLKVITLKLFDTYGPLDPRPKLFSFLKKACESNTPLPMSKGEQLLDLVYIDDVVEAFTIAAAILEAGQIGEQESFTVSSGKHLKLKEVVNLYSQTIGRSPNIHWGARSYRQREVMTPWSKGAALPGWIPIVELKEGIQMMERLYLKSTN